MTATITATLSHFTNMAVQAILMFGLTCLTIMMLSLLAGRAARDRALAEGRDGDKARQETALMTRLVLGLAGIAWMGYYLTQIWLPKL